MCIRLNPTICGPRDQVHTVFSHNTRAANNVANGEEHSHHTLRNPGTALVSTGGILQGFSLVGATCCGSSTRPVVADGPVIPAVGAEDTRPFDFAQGRLPDAETAPQNVVQAERDLKNRAFLLSGD
jgi:hypothetical protein